MNVEGKIHKQLENFFGKDSNVPAFYHDACQILKLKDKYPFKTSSHLIGHCLREIDSAIRETLREEHESRKKEIEKIISGILSVIEDDKNKKKELEDIEKIWSGLNLHKYAHRNNIEPPRDTEEIKKLFNDFNEVLSTLLPYLLEYVDKIKQRIDKLVNSKDKTGVLDEFGKAIPESLYFFSYLFNIKEFVYNPTWHKNKILERFIKRALKEIKKDRESSKRIIEEVIDCILKMKENKNAIVLNDLIKIIAEIPLDSLEVDNKKVKKLSEKVYKWMEKSDYFTHTHLFLSNTLWKTVINIAKVDVKSGLTLVKYLLDVNKYESEVRLFLLYHRENLSELISITKLQGFKLLCSLLEKEVQYNDPNIRGKEDYSHRWYNTEKEHKYRLRGILVASILENAKFMIEDDINSLESILKVIENRQFKVFCRIARDIIEPYKDKSEEMYKKYEKFANKCKKEDEVQSPDYWTPLIDDILLEYIDKFSHLEVSDIINELRKHEEPDHSIVNALEQVIKDNPEKFMKEIDNFIDIHPVYQERLIGALHTSSLEKGVLFDWEKILKLIKEIIYEENNKEDVLLVTARLINYTLEKNLIPIDYKNELWEIIDRILDKPKTNNEQLEYTLSLLAHWRSINN